MATSTCRPIDLAWGGGNAPPSCKLVDLTTLDFILDAPLDLRHARWLRGALGRRGTRPEFHQHARDALVYSHPLIRYDTSAGAATVAGLAEGAYLLKALPAVETLHLGGTDYAVRATETRSCRIAVGAVEQFIEYEFRSPYLALNQENYNRWSRADDGERTRLLRSVVIGNLLSFSKAVGLNVTRTIEASVDLVPDCSHEVKPGLRLLGFVGAFRVNFRLPDGWGIGKSSARGFGTILRREAANG